MILYSILIMMLSSNIDSGIREWYVKNTVTSSKNAAWINFKVTKQISDNIWWKLRVGQERKDNLMEEKNFYIRSWFELDF